MIHVTRKEVISSMCRQQLQPMKKIVSILIKSEQPTYKKNKYKEITPKHITVKQFKSNVKEKHSEQPKGNKKDM